MEIKQYPNENIWDFDQRFKTLMERVSFEMSDIQHKEWFIVTLLSHIILLLMKQNIVTLSKDLEIDMKMEDSPVGENAIGMNKI